MKLTAHWARACAWVDGPSGRERLSAVGWSDDGEGRARELAEARLARVLEQRVRGFPDKRGYEYDIERPIAETVVDQVTDRAGDTLGLLTRNAYGALVLNTDRAVFIDVDFPTVPEAKGLFAGLFRKAPSPERVALERVEQAAHAYPGWAFRVYRTHAGLRIVVLNQAVVAFDASHVALLSHFGSDPLYVKLCIAQHCFRARLTPKPWRLGLPRPPARFPFSDDEERAGVDAWLLQYERARAGYAVCRPLSTLGLGHESEVVRSLLSAHDALAVRDGAPLA